MPRTRAKVTVRNVDRGWNQLRKTAAAIRDRKAYVKAGVLAGVKEERPGEAMTNVELRAHP